MFPMGLIQYPNKNKLNKNKLLYLSKKITHKELIKTQIKKCFNKDKNKTNKGVKQRLIRIFKNLIQLNMKMIYIIKLN